MKKHEREEILESHPYAIYQTTEGRWRTYIVDDKKREKRKPVVKSRREDLEEFLIRHYSKKTQPKTMETIFDEWQTDKARTAKQATISRDRRTWEKYLAGTDIVARRLDKIEPREIKVWIEELIKDEHLTKHQYTNIKTVLNQILKYAAAVGYIDRSPLADIEVSTSRLQQEHKAAWQTQVYLDDELVAVRRLAWEDFTQRKHRIHQLAPLAFLFMFLTGIRIGEACAVRWSDINNGRLTIRRFLSQETGEVEECTKGVYGDRGIVLVKAAFEILNASMTRQQETGIYNKNGFVFSMRADPLPYATLAKCFYRYCNDAGIAPKSSHKARKTFGSMIQAGGVSLDAARQILGHTDERTTLHSYVYNRDADEILRQKMEIALSR